MNTTYAPLTIRVGNFKFVTSLGGPRVLRQHVHDLARKSTPNSGDLGIDDVCDLMRGITPLLNWILYSRDCS